MTAKPKIDDIYKIDDRTKDYHTQIYLTSHSQVAYFYILNSDLQW